MRVAPASDQFHPTFFNRRTNSRMMFSTIEAVRGAMIVSIQDGRAVSLTIHADTRSYDNYGPMLEEIVESYRSGGK